MEPSLLAVQTKSSPGRAVPLLVPFAYFFHSRVPTLRHKLGWAISYLLPVLALAAVAHGGLPGLAAAAAMLVAVYSAYEFGYIINDTLTVTREARPTLRLTEASRAWMHARLLPALVVRSLTGMACLALLYWAAVPNFFAVMLGWLALWPCFALYNHWRGRITIALHFVLVSLRFMLPILAATQAASIAPAWPLLLLLYALPNTYEAAWKQRYALPGLQRPFGDEYRFRLTWYLLLTALALGWLVWGTGAPRWVFAAACAYYLMCRLVAFWMVRNTPSR